MTTPWQRQRTDCTKPSARTDPTPPRHGTTSISSNLKPSAGCTGSTSNASTATATTHHQQPSKQRTTLPNKPPPSGLETNKPSLHQSQGGSVRGVIFHSDRGSQYTSNDFGKLCRTLGVVQSMGRTGVCFDNAAAESFFSTLKRELVHRYHWDTAQELHQGLFQWIESWYNRRRRHTTIGMKTPHQAYTDRMNHRTA